MRNATGNPELMSIVVGMDTDRSCFALTRASANSEDWVQLH